MPQAISLPAQPLGDALRELAKLTQLQVFAPGRRGKVAPPVTGAGDALARLLEGKDPDDRGQGPGVIVLRENTSQTAVARSSPPSVPKPALRDRTAETGSHRRDGAAPRGAIAGVPISISAYSQRAMDARSMRTIEDVARLTPGAARSRHQLQFGVVAQHRHSGHRLERWRRYHRHLRRRHAHLQPAPVLRHFNAYPMLFDLDRVQVLHGPQGTLFGASTEGGAVRFITPEPSLEKSSRYVRAEMAGTAARCSDFRARPRWRGARRLSPEKKKSACVRAPLRVKARIHPTDDCGDADWADSNWSLKNLWRASL